MSAPVPDDDALEAAARVVHEAVRAWARSAGDVSIRPWGNAPKWMKEATRAAIRFRLDNPDAPPSAQHDQWMADKEAAGWRFGKTKDPVKKTHPLMIPYGELPAFERRKDALVAAVITALLGDID